MTAPEIPQLREPANLVCPRARWLWLAGGVGAVSYTHLTQGHDLLEEIEGRFHEKFGHIVVDTHLEPIEDPRSYDAPQLSLIHI